MSNSTSDPCSDPIEWSCSSKIVPAILVSIGAGLATSVGGALVFFPQFLKSVPQQVVLAVALALSAGVMLYVSFIEIFVKSLDAISQSDAGFTEGGATALTTGCFFGGMLFCALLEILVDWMTGGSGHGDNHGGHVGCPAHGLPAPLQSSASSDSPSPPPSPPSTSTAAQVKVDVRGESERAEEGGGDVGGFTGQGEKSKLSRMGLMTAAAIAIHNFPEGLATFLGTLEDAKVGASLGVAVAIDNVPEGLCVAMPIYYATGNPWKAFLWSFLSGLTEPIGGILGFAVLQPVFTELVFGIVFSMVGGMMVFIVCHELLPASHRYMGSQAKATFWLIVGMVVMACSLVLFSDWDTPAKS